MDADVRHVPERSRYELVDDDEVVAFADYRLDGERIVLPHTVVSPHLRGRGLGDLLVRGVLDDVRRRDLRVVPTCWFVADFIERHPDDADLLAN